MSLAAACPAATALPAGTGPQRSWLSMEMGSLWFGVLPCCRLGLPHLVTPSYTFLLHIPCWPPLNLCWWHLTLPPFVQQQAMPHRNSEQLAPSFLPPFIPSFHRVWTFALGVTPAYVTLLPFPSQSSKRGSQKAHSWPLHLPSPTPSFFFPQTLKPEKKNLLSHSFFLLLVKPLALAGWGFSFTTGGFCKSSSKHSTCYVKGREKRIWKISSQAKK